MNITKKNLITYALIITFALLFLFIGNIITSDGMIALYDDELLPTVEARINRILDVAEIQHTDWMSDTVIIFEASIMRGDRQGEIVTATQVIINYFYAQPREVAQGDRVVLIYTQDDWHFFEYVRINTIIFLGVVFIVLLLLFGKFKGLNAVLSLGFTCVAIFAVFIPSILSGRNIYMWAIIVCIYVVIVTLLLLNGVNKKSLTAIVGCFGGILSAAILTLIMDRALALTGMIDTDFVSLTFLPTANPINLNAIIFAGIIIGAVGAVMDVAVSISSALWELKRTTPQLSFGEFLKSGINIGRDIMGSMTNTLVLAYIGSSLTVILLLIVYTDSLAELLSRELVIIELLKALIGGMGILLTMPLTAIVCAILYPQSQEHHKDEDSESEDDLNMPQLEDFFSELDRMEQKNSK